MQPTELLFSDEDMQAAVVVPNAAWNVSSCMVLLMEKIKSVSYLH